MKLFLEWVEKARAKEYFRRILGRCYRDGCIELVENGTEQLRQTIKNSPPRFLNDLAGTKRLLSPMGWFGNGTHVAIVGTFNELPRYWNDGKPIGSGDLVGIWESGVSVDAEPPQRAGGFVTKAQYLINRVLYDRRVPMARVLGRLKYLRGVLDGKILFVEGCIDQGSEGEAT